MISTPLSPVPQNQLGPQQSPLPSPSGSNDSDATSTGQSPFLQIIASLTTTGNDATAATDSTGSGASETLPILSSQPKTPKPSDDAGSSAASNYQLLIGLLSQLPSQTFNNPQPLQSAQSTAPTSPTPVVVQPAGSALLALIAAPITTNELVQAPANVDRQADTANSAGTAQPTNPEQVSQSLTIELSQLAGSQAASDGNATSTTAPVIESPATSGDKATKGADAKATVLTGGDSADGIPNREIAQLASMNLEPQPGQPAQVNNRRTNSNGDPDRFGLSKVALVTDSIGLPTTNDGIAASVTARPFDPSNIMFVQGGGGSGNSNGAQTTPTSASLIGGNSQPREVSWPEAVHGVASTALARIERDGLAEFRFRVSPPDMGEISIRLTGGPSGVTGEMTVGSSAIQQLVESRLPELRQQLETAGVSVSSFNVTHQGGSSPDSSRQNAAAWDVEALEDVRPTSIGKRTRAGGLSRGLVDVTV